LYIYGFVLDELKVSKRKESQPRMARTLDIMPLISIYSAKV
jgi:hypothetical protein